MQKTPFKRIVQIFSRLPGLGPRSARKIALHLLQHKSQVLEPLIASLEEALDIIKVCSNCGNLDAAEQCAICTDSARDPQTLCIVAGVDDLWALEKTKAFKGHYHVLGGVLSALDGVGPDQLNLKSLPERLRAQNISEVILALNTTLEGQTTSHYIADLLGSFSEQVTLTKLAHGVPIGGELEYLDDGTITVALNTRKPFA